MAPLYHDIAKKSLDRNDHVSLPLLHQCIETIADAKELPENAWTKVFTKAYFKYVRSSGNPHTVTDVSHVRVEFRSCLDELNFDKPKKQFPKSVDLIAMVAKQKNMEEAAIRVGVLGRKVPVERRRRPLAMVQSHCLNTYTHTLIISTSVYVLFVLIILVIITVGCCGWSRSR